jgi:tripartite-type tricarboxylate transporter receptor subunit TctC
MPSRRRFLATSAAGLASALSGMSPQLFAQPGKTARIVVGFPAGGGTDVIARLIGEKLRGSYAPAVIVENKVGAAGRIAIDFVRNSDPDGSTMLFTPDFPMTVYPHSFRKLSYDPLRDFTPVATCAKSTLCVSAGPGLPSNINTVAEFVQWCRANPKQASYATTSAGATPHFTGVMLSRASGVEMTAVHYKGGAPALQDLLGGQVPMSVNPIGEVLPYVKSGKLRVLAVTGAKRSTFLPDVPNMVESGYKDIVVEAWLGFFVPSKTPADVVARLAAAIGDAARGDDVTQSFLKFGNETSVATGPNFVSLLRSDIDRWGPVVKASGFTAED